ncbi:GNAT family N-acetyltransferase [Candidatus Woesearchaeota archaeon]|nr:GNAT family N-acetyltransferase [Candidatus Woesearchaeota archaeon]
MKPKIQILTDAKLREFIDYLEQIPYSAYQKKVVLDEKDVFSFGYVPNNKYIIAVDKEEADEDKGKDKIIGHICIMSPYTQYGYHQEHILEVHINIIPEYQHKGVGKALLEFFLQEIKKGRKNNGIKKIKTKMLASNEPAIKLFEKFGFKKEALLKKEWKMIIEDEKTGKKKEICEDCLYMSLGLE